ncbi:metal ABC transporter ATP-binding protein [Myceligenerans salitolerans]|uniref:ATP-binding cassette domain-containing protein n=1 Tax=Myceligenerans salitolerans TaxID=1230528 RepID=A0ABS3I6D0_9MICO|nr:ATP-binding cassette domain-containing protein [Myceligenerans salitolerans]MBO0608038.1 ATP-binding cassette domain-containing protein [Myceligenerans salitolerans]
MSRTTAEHVIEVERLHVHAGASHILRGVDLTVRAGEAVTLLGANGSGKSTLVKALVGVAAPSQGTVRVLGARLGTDRVPWERVGYVPQRAGARTGVPSTAAEVVASGLLSGRRWWLPRGWRTRVRDALDQVGLADRTESAMHVLSGGQQQRVLIARALVRDPDVLVLDEPVAGVDHPSQEAFAASVRRLVERGVTVLVVLHELGELDEIVSRAVVLRHGLVVHDGAPPRPRADHDAAAHRHLHPHDDEARRPAPLTQNPVNGSTEEVVS